MNAMVSNRNRQNQPVQAAAALREQADALLHRLERSRSESERRMAELGRRDAIKHVTGRTALDEAVVRTRAMIQQMDGLLGAMHHEIEFLERGQAHPQPPTQPAPPQPAHPQPAPQPARSPHSEHHPAVAFVQREPKPVAMLGVR